MHRMGLYIRNPETGRLARELAARTGETITGAVTRLLRQSLAEPAPALSVEARMARIRELQARSAARPVLDERSGDEILYDEDGLPK